MAIKNVNDWEENFEAMETEMQKAAIATAYKVKASAQRRAPVDTGELRNSATIGELHAQNHQISIDVTFEADYASFVEEGHFNVNSGKFVAPQPFLGPSLKEAEGTLEDEMNRAMERAFKQ